MIADPSNLRPALARAAGAASKRIPGASLLTAVEGLNSDELCRTCGACCSYSADWPRFSLEYEARLDRIPRELVGDEKRGMRCTGAGCAALVGIVGQATSCAIYPRGRTSAGRVRQATRSASRRAVISACDDPAPPVQTGLRSIFLKRKPR